MRHRLAIGAWALAGPALAAPAFGHGDESRDQAPPARADCVPLSTPPADDAGDKRLGRVIEELLADRPAAPQTGSEPPGLGPA